MAGVPMDVIVIRLGSVVAMFLFLCTRTSWLDFHWQIWIFLEVVWLSGFSFFWLHPRRRLFATEVLLRTRFWLRIWKAAVLPLATLTTLLVALSSAAKDVVPGLSDSARRTFRPNHRHHRTGWTGRCAAGKPAASRSSGSVALLESSGCTTPACCTRCPGCADHHRQPCSTCSVQSCLALAAVESASRLSTRRVSGHSGPDPCFGRSHRSLRPHRCYAALHCI